MNFFPESCMGTKYEAAKPNEWLGSKNIKQWVKKCCQNIIIKRWNQKNSKKMYYSPNISY